MVSVSEFLSSDRGLFSNPTGSFLPREVYIPLESDDNEKFDVLVYEGNSVEEGEIIARSKNICVHSSVPGIVKNIFDFKYANGRQGKVAKIELKGAFSFTGKKYSKKSDWASMDSMTLSFFMKDNGITNTFDRKSEPIFASIKKFRTNGGKILAVRLFDDDPSREIENFLSKKYLSEIIEGAFIVARTISAAAIVFAFNKKEKSILDFDFEKLLDKVSEGTQIFTVPIDIKKYPCGTKHDIVSSTKKQYKDEILKNFGRNDFFIDSKSVLKVYDAFVLGIPSIFEYVHVTGNCLNAAAVIKARIGTPINFLAEQCGSFKQAVGKIVINGIILGRSVSSLEVPVSRDMKSVEFLMKSVSASCSENCIRCGNCRKICPLELWPETLFRYVREGIYDKELVRSALLCSECGLCNAVCPSRLPLSQVITVLKTKLEENKNGSSI